MIGYAFLVLVALALIAWSWKETTPAKDYRTFIACVVLISLGMAGWFLPKIMEVSLARLLIDAAHRVFPVRP
jgi:Na+/H+-dicarboxylate symporter